MICESLFHDVYILLAAGRDAQHPGTECDGQTSLPHRDATAEDGRRTHQELL